MRGNPVKVDLTIEQLMEADEVAYARRNVGGKPANNLNVSQQTELLMDITGARGERAVWTLFPELEWHTDARPGIPDIGDFIDVKTPLQKGDEARRSLIHFDPKLTWAYVLVLPNEESPLWVERSLRFWVIGWAWGHELAAAPVIEFHPGRPCHRISPFVPPLHPIEELQDIAKVDVWA